MMDALDPRHGTSAGYCAGCRDECCRTAIADYSRGLRARQYLAGGPLIVDALGTKRRIRALMALGWTGRQIDVELGRKPTYTANLLCGPDRVNRATAASVAAVYERLSMRLPADAPDANRQVIARTRSEARRKGWAPPLAYDNIDDPTEQPSSAPWKPRCTTSSLERDDYDEAVVLRLLDHDTTVTSTHAERVEAMRRWLSMGRSEKSLCAIHRWKDGRYVTREVAA
jgi:hypothetical protein